MSLPARIITDGSTSESLILDENKETITVTINKFNKPLAEIKIVKSEWPKASEKITELIAAINSDWEDGKKFIPK